VRECGADASTADKNGQTPVWMAALQGHTKTVRALVKQCGADPSTADYTGCTPVRVARTVPSNCICRCSRMRACLSPPRVLLPHTCTLDGWFLQPKRRPARLPRRTVPSNCICKCSRKRARLPLHILLLHTQVSR
jgi:hypothetical protein